MKLSCKKYKAVQGLVFTSLRREYHGTALGRYER